MIGTEWFEVGGMWHIVTLGDSAKAECGLTMRSAPATVASTAESPWPPKPCMACAVRAQERYMEEEPLDEALARGFRPADPSDLE